MGWIPSWGTKIPYAECSSQKKKKNPNKSIFSIQSSPPVNLETGEHLGQYSWDITEGTE